MLFPNLEHDADYYLNKYGARNLPNGAEVTRLGPSPTGFLHIGHLYSAMINQNVARKTGGVFYLRLEDTDQKRFINGAGDIAYQMLCYYGVVPDEGYRGDSLPQKGDYGDYIQSHRIEIYKAFAKKLVENGRAFPCFCAKSECKDDILERREKDIEENDTITEHDECRNLTMEEIEKNLAEGKPWALRLLSMGDPEKVHDFVDQIKGKRKIRENAKDVVLIKSDGIPPYALAHVVDDTLMHTTTVVRGEEWYPSVAAHIEIFRALGLTPPKYAHTPVICKLDDGNKRKLSKRKDPEADVRYYIENGYPIDAVKEYVLNLLNSDFELWRAKNPTAKLEDFDFSIRKIGSNNPMFDFDKLDNISKNVISRLTAEQVYDATLTWARDYDKPFAKLLEDNREMCLKLFSIDRGGDRPRKDIVKWSMVKEQYKYMFAELFDPNAVTFEEKFATKNAKLLLEKYKNALNLSVTNQEWFAQVKDLALACSFAESKDYKLNPSAYAGNIADACNIIRIAVTGKSNTPDLLSIMQLLGADVVTSRLENAIKKLGK
jgi:glutamyl-tRNA synthetase